MLSLIVVMSVDASDAKKVMAAKVKDLVVAKFGEFYAKKVPVGLREARLRWCRERRLAVEAKRRGAVRVRGGARFVVMREDWVGKLLLICGLVDEKKAAEIRADYCGRGVEIFVFDVSVLRLKHGEDSRSFCGEELKWRECAGVERKCGGVRKRVGGVYGKGGRDGGEAV